MQITAHITGEAANVSHFDDTMRRKLKTALIENVAAVLDNELPAGSHITGVDVYIEITPDHGRGLQSVR